LGLDIPDKCKLDVNNVDDQLEGRSSPTNSKVLWNEKITRKHGHLYLCPSFVIILKRAQLDCLHKHFVHPTVKSLFEMLKQALLDETNLRTRHLLEQIRAKCVTYETTAGKPPHFRVSAISEDDAELNFIRQVDIDLLRLNDKPARHVCDHDTRFSAKVLKGETTLHVLEALLMS
jgi:hypothetical protein